jgi:hypothetical protein
LLVRSRRRFFWFLFALAAVVDRLILVVVLDRAGRAGGFEPAYPETEDVEDHVGLHRVAGSQGFDRGCKVLMC